MMFSVAHVQGCTRWNRTHLTIELDGSSNIRTPDGKLDWLFNAAAIPFGVVHAGFLYEALRVYNHLRNQITKATEVRIIGRSKGGGIAEVLPLFIKDKRVTVHNLGGPAVWSRFSVLPEMFLDAKVYWYTAGLDIVPWIPPWFRHVGTRSHIPMSGWNFIRHHKEGYKSWPSQSL